MVKKHQTKLGRNTILTIIGIVGICSVGGYYVVNSMIPVNGSSPVFGAPANFYVKSLPTQNGPTFVLSSTKSGKKSVDEELDKMKDLLLMALKSTQILIFLKEFFLSDLSYR